jgi:hypothetical protein
MNLKEFLESNPIINKAQLAEAMWDGNKSAKSKLYNKLAEKTVGSGKQRVTEADELNAKKNLMNLAENIINYVNDKS